MTKASENGVCNWGDARGLLACKQVTGTVQNLGEQEIHRRRQHELLVEETGMGTEFLIKTSAGVREGKQRHGLRAGNRDVPFCRDAMGLNQHSFI